MTPDVPAWCREEAKRVAEAWGFDIYEEESVAHALHAAYRRGLEAAAGVCEAEGHKWRDDAGRPAPGPMLCAAAIRALARG